MREQKQQKHETDLSISHCYLTFLSFLPLLPPAYVQMGAYFSLQACMSLPLRPEVELIELGGHKDPVESSALYWVQGGSEGGVGVVGYSMQACYQVTGGHSYVALAHM